MKNILLNRNATQPYKPHVDELKQYRTADSLNVQHYRKYNMKNNDWKANQQLIRFASYDLLNLN